MIAWTPAISGSHNVSPVVNGHVLTDFRFGLLPDGQMLFCAGFHMKRGSVLMHFGDAILSMS